MPLICQKCRFLDKAATFTEEDYHNPENTKQMEDVHSNASGGGEMCFADDAYLCTIFYSIVFTQMASVFVEQGAPMSTRIGYFHIPPSSNVKTAKEGVLHLWFTMGSWA